MNVKKEKYAQILLQNMAKHLFANTFKETRIKRKKDMNTKHKSIYAGLLIGLGDVIYVSQNNKIIGAMLFSLGLLTIIHQKLFLYTGKIGFLNLRWNTYATIIIGNFIGVSIPVIMMCVANNDFNTKVINIAESKMDKTMLQLLILGILCGMCMHIAVTSKNIIITMFCVMVFILSGYEHCIADFPYMAFGFVTHHFEALLKLITITIGNSLGALFINFLIPKSKRGKYEILKDKFYGHS